MPVAIGFFEGLFLMIPLAILVLAALAFIQKMQRNARSDALDAPGESQRLEAQVESLQEEIERLRERQDFVENLRTPPKPPPNS